MGRIKTSQVKSVTHRLMEEHEDEFSKKFGDNKELVERFTDITSKKLRNIIAGYITRLKKIGG